MMTRKMKRLWLTVLALLPPALVFAAGSAPVIEQGDGPITVQMNENHQPGSWTPPSLSAFDLEGDDLTWGLVSGATPTGVIPGRMRTQHGVVQVEGSGASPSRFTYRPDPGHVGEDSFTVGVSDGSGFDGITVNVMTDRPPEPVSAEPPGSKVIEVGSRPNSDPSPTKNKAEPVPNYTLSIFVHGQGTVRTNLEGFTCSAVCAQGFSPGFEATLVAEPEPGHVLSEWSGDCVGTGDCRLVMDQHKSIDVKFSPAGGDQ